MTAPVEVEVDARAALQSMGRKFRRLDPLLYMPAIGQRVLAWVDENFRRHGIEKPWKPLSPNTLAARRRGRGGGTAQPLRDTGRMAQSFVSDPHGANAVWVGTRDEKAAWHHFGTRPYVIRPRRRKFLRFITAQVQQQRGRRPGKAKGRGGFFTFAREVHHPGLPARPLLPSRTLARELATEALRVYAAKALREP